MHSKHFRLLCAAVIMLTAMMACNLSSPGDSATLTPETATIQIGDEVPTPTETLLPTETATSTPAETETPTITPEPSLTPTPELPHAEVVNDVYCRAGPSGAYDLVVTLKGGDEVDVLARDLGAGYVFVSNPEDPEQGCWVTQNDLSIDGNLTPLPAFSPPPSPTLAPGFTITYKNIDKCKGNAYVRFIVVNTGSIGFRSAYIRVTNLKNQEVAEQVVNAFDIMTGCIVAQNIAPLSIGQTGNLQSPVFQKGNPQGQKMQAAFQLCTEQNLKGICVSQSLQFTAK